MAITQTFSESVLQQVDVGNPTSLQFGPDGRLYISQQNGLIKVYDVTKVGDTWTASNGETIDLVQDIPNHNDDGSLNTSQNSRQVTGLSVEGTAENPVLYVTSSDPRIGAGGSGNDSGLDTNSGVLSRLTWNGSSWDKVDLVIGLPRSEENHSTNGFDIRTETVEVSPGVFEEHQIMYLAQGGHANKGGPSNNFAYLPEYYYSAAVLRVDLTQLEAIEADLLDNGGLNGGTAYVDEYVYALPTLDDPTRANDLNGHDTAAGTTGAADAEAGGTFGGNDGRNQAKYDPGGPVQVYSPGYRNHYDVVNTEKGNLYTFDNGPNGGWGDEPIDTSNNTVTSDGQTATNRPDSLGNSGSDPTSNDGAPDNLHLVTDGSYGGHPNPTRASGADAELYAGVQTSDQGTDITYTTQLTGGNGTQTLLDDLPSDWQTITGGNTNPEEGVWISPNSDGSLLSIGSSTNGLAEYLATGLGDGGPNTEYLVTASFNGNITLIEIETDGTQGNTSVTDTQAIGVSGTPLDVTTLGNTGIPGSNGMGAGAIFVAQYGSNAIVILEPGTPPTPDDDADNDGILDVDDPLQFDPDNGTSTVLAGGETLFWDFNPAAGNYPGSDDGTGVSGDYGIGMTGWMVNGTDELNPELDATPITDLDNTIRGGAPGIFQIKSVTEGDAYTTDNSQKDALQTGFSVAENVATFDIAVPTLNVFSSDANTGIAFTSYGSMGIALGTGDQSNYIKFVVGATSAGARLQVLHEEGDAVLGDQTTSDIADLLPPATVDDDVIELGFAVDMSDPQAITVQAQYRFTQGNAGLGGDPIPVGTAITLDPDSPIAEALRGEYTIGGQPSAPVVTMLATSTGAQEPFVADFLEMTISSTEKDVAPSAADDFVETGVGVSVDIPVSALLANDTDLNADTLTVTGVSNAVGGQVTLNDNGTPGDTSDDTVTFIPDVGFEGVGSFDYEVSDGTGLTDTATVDVSVADEVVLYRVNAGGGAIAALDDGPDWSADTGTANSPYLAEAGSNGTTGFPAVEPDGSVPDTTPAAVYDTERWDNDAAPEMQWEFAVDQGIYEVRLYLGNGFDGTSEAGQRVFDVAIEDSVPVNLDDLDLSFQYGHQVGKMIANRVMVTDGTLDIDFIHGVENPLVNAIEIVKVGSLATDPTVSITGGDQVVGEGGGQIQISLLSDVAVPAAETVEVTFQIVPGAATAGADYSYASPTAAFDPGTGIYTDTVTIAGASSDATFLIDILQDGDVEPAEAFTVNLVGVSGNAQLGGTTSATVTINDDDGASTQPIYRVNVGGAEVAAADGSSLAWSADTGAFGDAGNSPYLAALSTGSSTFDTGSGSAVAISSYDAGISPAAPDAIFETERYDQDTAPEMLWEFPVAAAGQYVVNLFLAEIFDGIGGAGERVFDIAVEGVVPATFDDIDPYAIAGPGGAFMLSETVTVTDGSISIEAIHGVENPALKGIEIVALDGSPPPTLSIAPPAVASVEETGDTGVTALGFPVGFSAPPAGPVTVAYEVDINGTVTGGLTQALGTADGTIVVEVPNDALANGPEDVTVTLTGISAGAGFATLGDASASATVTEDDTGGAIVAAINAGGPALSQDGIDFAADDHFSTPSTVFVDGAGGNGEQPVFDGTVFETERYGTNFSYSIPVGPGLYDVDLYLSELYQSDPGQRIFDVVIEGVTVLDDFDILDANGGDIDQALIETFENIDPSASGDPNAIDITFEAEAPDGVDNAKISAIVVREAEAAPTGGAATFSITANANDVDSSNYGSNSFQITNSGNKVITGVSIDVSQALYIDAVFDPFGLAGDLTSKPLTINTLGNTGLVLTGETDGGGAPIFGQGSIGTVYEGAGGTAGFEKLNLTFSNATNGGFQPGETLGFAVDMDPNSIAGASKGTLDSGADASSTPGGSTEDWDIGGVSGAELIGATYTITFEDGTTATGQLTSNGNQAGAIGIASQDSPDLAVSLTVNGLEEGGVGTYSDDGPSVIINGAAGQVARVVLTKGFIQPGENNFTDAYAAQLDAQLDALAASDFPANNAVEFQVVDVVLTGADQDISNLFDVSQLFNGVEFGGGWTDLQVDQLPLGLVASVIDPANGDVPLGPVTAPVYLQYAENAPPQIAPIGDITIDEAEVAAFDVTATDAESDPIALAVEVTRDSDGTTVAPSAYTFTDNGDGTGSFGWTTGEADDGAYTITVTADDGTSQSTETLQLVVDEVADPQPGTVLYRVNAGGAEVAATDGGPVWSADTEQANSPYLVNPGSNNDYPSSGTPQTGIDMSLLGGTGVPEAVIGIERWDDISDANGEMAYAFDVAAGTEVTVNLYLAELYEGLPDLDGSGDATGDRVFDVSVDGIVPAAFESLDPYGLAGDFGKGVVVSHTLVSDGTIDLAFLHDSQNPAVKGLEVVIAGTAETDGPAATLTGAPDVAAAGTDYQFTVEYTDATGVDVSSLDSLDVTVSNGSATFSTTATLVSVNPPADGSPRTATYTITPPGGSWSADDNGTYTITLNGGEVADILGNAADGATLGTFDVAVPTARGELSVAVTPGEALEASTFSDNSFQLTNTGEAGVQITSVAIDLSTAILPNIVFDPTGTGGDATAKVFTPNSGAAATGLVAPADPASDPFSAPRNGGFDVLTINFDDFDPGETFTFTTDIDPNSIQGVPGAGDAGSVSGYELIGATVTTTFSDGTVSVGSLFDESSFGVPGSLGGSRGVVSSAPDLAAPILSVVGAGPDQVGTLPGDQVEIGGTDFTVLIEGPAGATVELLQMDTRLYIASGDPAFGVSAGELPFYANEAMAGKALVTGTIGPDGTLEVPLSLLETPGSGTSPDGGVNAIMAVIKDGDEISVASTPLVVKLGAPLVYDAPGVTEFDGTAGTVIELPHGSQYEFPQGTVAFSFNAADTSGAQGLFAKDASGYVGGGNHFALYLDGDVLTARYQDGTSQVILTFDGIAAGTEYEVAATFGPNGAELWVDGNLVASDPLIMDWTQNAEVIQWGGRGWASSTGETGFDAPFEGTISDPQIYSAVLTASQIAALASGSTGTNTPPVAVDDAVVTDEDTPVVVSVADLLANDSDADGDAIDVSMIATDPANGTAVLDAGAGTITYTPDADFSGADAFTITVSDGSGGATTSTVAVTVNAVNDDPVAAADAASTVIDTAVVIDLLANDGDVDGDSLTVTAIGATQNGGSVVDNGDGTVSYTPAAGYTGPDAFTYTVSDGNGGSDTASVTVDVLSAPNQAPDAVDDDLAVDEDQVLALDLTANDSDPEGEPLTVTAILSGPAHGTVDLGAMTYTPDADFNGTDTFTYELSDGFLTDTATVTVNVAPVNDAPVANDDAASTAEETAVAIDLLGNDTDVDGDTLTIDSVDTPANGSVVLNPNGTVTYTPDAGFSGTDTFDYTVTDGTETATASVSVDVTSFPEPVFDAPIGVTFDGTNGSVIELPPSAGTQFPAGTVAFTFTADDTSGAQGLFTKDASGFAGGGNHLAIYLQGSTLVARFQNGDSVSLQVPGISAGVEYDVAATFGPDGSNVYLDGELVASSGLVMDWTDNVEYIQWGGRGWGSQSGQPGFDAPFDGTISNRQIYDVSLSESEVAELHADGPPNADPLALDDVVATDEDTPVTFAPLANDTDSDGDALTVQSVATQAANGTVSIAPNDEVTYTPDANFNGTDSFELVIADGKGGFDTSTVDVTVASVDDDPVAVADTATTTVGEAVVIDVLANDVEVDGDPLSVVGITGIFGGSVTDNGDGTVTFTPAGSEDGGFTYEVSDGDGPTSTADVTIDVTEEPALPTPVFSQPGISTYSGSNGDVDNYAHDPALAIEEGTIAFSFVDDNPGQTQGLVVKDASGYVGGGHHFAAYIQDGDLKVRFQDAGSETIITAEDLVAGQEYEVAAMFGADGVSLYLDGALVGSDDLVMNWEQNDQYMQVGGLGWGSPDGGAAFGNAFSGQIADVEIYDEELGNDLIQELANMSSFDLV